MNDFFTDLGGRWAKAARERGSEIEPPVLDSAVAFELLELARVTAHSSERRFAPLSCYLAGIAVERVRAARGELSDSEAAAHLNDVRQSLESRSTLE